MYGTLHVPYYRDLEFVKKFGLRVREIRTETSLSQEELAHRAGLDTSQIGRIERGVVNTSLSVIKRLADGLKVPVSDLFDS
jgi:transcriptional regulator with XRE-family HTH domain